MCNYIYINIYIYVYIYIPCLTVIIPHHIIYGYPPPYPHHWHPPSPVLRRCDLPQAPAPARYFAESSCTWGISWDGKNGYEVIAG